jgi:hypothetical protein
VGAGRGSVVFQVWGDGIKLFESTRLVGGNAPVPVKVDVTGRNDLLLAVTDSGDGPNYDHADWANPQLNCTTSPSGTVTRYMSDLAWGSMTNGWGPAERDMSNGESAANDGRPMKLKGVGFTKGVGAHSASAIHYAMGGACSSLAGTVGVDDEVPIGLGSVTFQVWGDGLKLYESPKLISGSTPVGISVNVTGKNDLALVVTDAGDGANYDHADWANARLTCSR